MTFERQMDETRGATAQSTCWCITIALHQEFGVGADRLNRIQNDLEKYRIYMPGNWRKAAARPQTNGCAARSETAARWSSGYLSCALRETGKNSSSEWRGIRLPASPGECMSWQPFECWAMERLASQGCWRKAARTMSRSMDGPKRAAWSTHFLKFASAQSWH